MVSFPRQRCPVVGVLGVVLVAGAVLRFLLPTPLHGQVFHHIPRRIPPPRAVQDRTHWFGLQAQGLGVRSLEPSTTTAGAVLKMGPGNMRPLPPLFACACTTATEAWECACPPLTGVEAGGRPPPPPTPPRCPSVAVRVRHAAAQERVDKRVDRGGGGEGVDEKCRKTRGGRPGRIAGPNPPPPPPDTPKFSNPSFSKLRFRGKVLVPKKKIWPPDGVIFFTLRVYTQKYSEFGGEFTNG